MNLDAFRTLVNGDMLTAFQDGLDNLVVTEIALAAGSVDNSGDDLFEQLRKGVTAVQGEGFNPTVAAVSPEDAEALDLTRSGGSTTDDGPFVLAPAPRGQAFSPLWNMQIRIVKDLVNPIVLDPSAVTLHLDAAIFSRRSVHGVLDQRDAIPAGSTCCSRGAGPWRDPCRGRDELELPGGNTGPSVLD